MKNNTGSSIKAKMLIRILLLVCISLIVVGTVSIYNSYSGTMQTLDKTMSETAFVAADVIKENLDELKGIVRQISRLTRLTSATVSVEDRIATLKGEQNNNGFIGTGYVDLGGNDLVNGSNIANTAYFKAAKNGAVCASEPFYNEKTKKLEIIIAAPVKKTTAVDAVIYFTTSADFLMDAVTNIQIGKTGGAYILDKDGYTIAHKNTDLVINRDNTNEDAKTDPSLKKLAAIETAMTEGKSGVGNYSYNGENKVLAYAPIEGTDGWSIGINVAKSEFIQGTINGIIITAILIGVCILAAVLIAIRLANSISRPITKCVDRIVLLSKGDLKSEIPEVKTNDETKLLENATRVVINTLDSVITEISSLLGEMANGNMAVMTSDAYIGDLSPIKESIDKIAYSLNTTLSQINQSSEQVLSGAQQVSAAAQSLAQGSVEQSSSVEELSSTISGILNEVNENTESVKQGMTYVEAAGQGVNYSNEQMQKLRAAMQEINTSSNEIRKIIQVIDDISFQTNILALNAAVEAARAGTAGKGFAVVAEEVRTLATKSAEAAKQTSILIESSLSSVQEGSRISEEAARSLADVVIKANLVSESMKKIDTASQQQASAIQQVTVGIDQISGVVQANSAGAEESAAASEELSSQADMLKKMVSQFQLSV